MMAELNDYDIAALKCVAGVPQDVFDGWGAGLGQSIEFVEGFGLVHRVDGAYELTAKGRDALDNLQG